MSFNYDELEAKFAPLVGQAILNFGNIEHFTMLVLDYLPSDRIIQTVSSLGFTKRVDLIIELLSARKATKAHLRMIDLLRETKRLAKKRNLIAHNPLRIEIFEHKKMERFRPQLAPYTDKNTKVTYQDIVDFSTKADSLAEELHDVFLKLISNQE